MSEDSSVVIYGATGYTGQLASEELARRGIPFVVSGRNQDKLDRLAETLRDKGADTWAVAVAHEVDALRGLLRGKKLVINISGPFQVLGPAVVEAAMAEKCHYVDVTGEQDFMMDMKSRFGEQAQRDELVLLTSNAFHWAPGACVADLALSTEGVDSLRVVYQVVGKMTIASAKSSFRVGKRPQYEISDGSLRQIDYRKGHQKLALPGKTEEVAACPLGTAEPVWFEEDSRVKNLEVLRADVASVYIARSFVTMQRMQKMISRDKLDWVTDKLTDAFWRTPPREEADSSPFLVWAEGSGPGVEVCHALRGSRPYVLTGHLAGEAAQRILAGEVHRHGFVGTHQAFGARSILESFAPLGCQLEQPDRPGAATDAAQSRAGAA